MQCPHCNRKVELLSNAMNKSGKVKSCPHCGGKVRLYVSLKNVLLWPVPAIVVCFLVSPLARTFLVGPVGALSLRLKPAEVAVVGASQ